MREPMPIVLQHWRHLSDLYRQPTDSGYATAAWLPRLGPTSFLLWGRLANELETHGPDVTVDLIEIAHSLGLGEPGKHGSALPRALKRLRRFRLTRPIPGVDAAVLVRVHAPPVGLATFRQLPAHVQRMHLEIFGVRTDMPSELTDPW